MSETSPPPSADGATPQAAPGVPARTAPEDCGPQLKALFPGLFANPPKPLKLRIQADIQERAPGQFTKQQLSAFLRRYTGSHGYLNALARGTHRFDLDGNAGDELSAEHRQAAADELARRRQVHNERRALEEQQRFNRATLLRDFERTTLTPANFCALKGLPLEELEPLLARARQEASEAPSFAAPQRPGPRPGPRPDHRPDRRPGSDRPRGAPPRR